MGKINTETILLLAAGAAAIYFITKKPTAPTYNPALYPPGYNPYAPVQSTVPGNTTGGIITAAGSAAGNIINAIWG
jgi:hypothetical protein